MAASRVDGDDRTGAGASADADLVVAVALTLSAVAATLLPFLADTPLRAVLGFGFVLFVPGYALVAALFPGERAAERDAPGGPARAALGVLSSVVLAALVGGALGLTVGLGPASAVLSLAVVSLLAAGVAARSRPTSGSRFPSARGARRHGRR